MDLLVVGHNVRHVACSASRAGHKVLAADCYSDLDMVDAVWKAARLECDPKDPEDLVRGYREFIRESLEVFAPDALVLGPGLEEMRAKDIRVLNNRPEKIEKVSDKLWLFRWLEKRGYPTPSTKPLEERDELKGRFIMVKPRKGAGGWKNRLVQAGQDVESSGEDLIAQEWVAGKPASVSVMSNGDEAVAISVNEQLIGEPWLGATGFRYCGNVVPLEGYKKAAHMAKMAEEIVADLGLVGSNGVDFLLTQEGFAVLEVNPRFQGSLDAVEQSIGMNIFQAHLESFEGTLPKSLLKKPSAQKTAARVVLFAERDLKIEQDLRKISERSKCWVADIPKPGSIVEKEGPLVSILAIGANRQRVMKLLQSKSSAVFERCTSI